MKILPNTPCPCNSGKKYKKCCRVFHNGELPKLAVELMRSRFTAFKMANTKYIIETTHPSNSDFTNDLKAWQDDILAFCLNTKFESLEIKEEINASEESYVTFKAELFQGNKDVSFVEKSRFLKVENKWLYVDGTFLD